MGKRGTGQDSGDSRPGVSTVVLLSRTRTRRRPQYFNTRTGPLPSGRVRLSVVFSFRRGRAFTDEGPLWFFSSSSVTFG